MSPVAEHVMVDDKKTKREALTAYAENYTTTLRELVLLLSPRMTSAVPEVLATPRLVVGFIDSMDKHFIEFATRDHAAGYEFAGMKPEYEDERSAGIIIANVDVPVEDVVFPEIPSEMNRSVACMVCRRAVTVKHLATCSKEFYAKYWSHGKWATMTGDVPFSVDANGSVSIFDHLYGYELDGNEHQRLYQFVQMFGASTLVPNTIEGVRDRAFLDLRSATMSGQAENDTWSFSEFLNNIAHDVMNNVLLLGPYRSETKDAFDRTKKILADFGYRAIVLSDAEDVPIHSNLEKLFAALICSSFVVVLDLEPSGHIAEVSELLNHDFRPVLILRYSERPSTAFLEDRVQTNSKFRAVTVEEISKETLKTHIGWALQLARDHVGQLNQINSWRQR